MKKLLLITSICFGLSGILSNLNAQNNTFTRIFQLDPAWVDNFTGICTTNDGGYVVQYMQNQMFFEKISCIRLDSTGNIIWQRYIDSPRSVFEGDISTNRRDIHVMTAQIKKVYTIGENSFVKENGSIATYNDEGENLWTKIVSEDSAYIFNQGEAYYLYDVCLTRENKIIAVGTTTNCNYIGDSLGYVGSYIVCYDTSGNLQWQWHDCRCGLPVYENSELFAVAEAENGDIIAVGYSNSTKYTISNLGYTTYQGLVVRIDSGGNLIYRKRWGWPECTAGFIDVGILPGDNIALAGFVGDTLEGCDDFRQLLLITDADANPLYQNNFTCGGLLGGGGSNTQSVAYGGDSCLYNINYTACIGPPNDLCSEQAIVIKKYNRFGQLLNYKIIGDTSLSHSSYMAITSHPEGGATVGFTFSKNTPSYHYGAYLIRVDTALNGDYPQGDFPDMGAIEDEYIVYNSIGEHSNTPIKTYPNPAGDELYVELPEHCLEAICGLYSTDGQLIKQLVLTPYENHIRLTGIPDGMYVLKLSCDTHWFVQKILIQQ